MQNFWYFLALKNYKKQDQQIRKIATQVYIHVVLDRSGEKNFKHLQEHFAKSPNQETEASETEYSGGFYKNARGDHAIKRNELINRIDKEYPGTERVFRHPLWFILEHPLADKETIYKKYGTLNSNIKDQLFKNDKKSLSDRRKKWSSTRPFYAISMQNNLDALACLLMLVKEMNIKERWHSYALAKRLALSLFFRLSYVSPLNIVADNLYEIIHNNFIAENPIPKIFQKAFFYEQYSPPPFIGSTTVLHKMFDEILENAGKYRLEESDNLFELNFLFWATTMGTMKSIVALKPNNSTKENQEFVESLFKSYRSNLEKHLPKGNLVC